MDILEAVVCIVLFVYIIIDIDVVHRTFFTKSPGTKTTVFVLLVSTHTGNSTVFPLYPPLVSIVCLSHPLPSTGPVMLVQQLRPPGKVMESSLLDSEQ